MFEDINLHRAAVAEHIAKSFMNDFGSEGEFEKANHKVGDVHPNGKWVWKEYAPGKFDWRGIKGGASSGGSSTASAASAPNKSATSDNSKNTTTTQQSQQSNKPAAPAQSKSNQSKSSGTYVPKGGSFSNMSAAEARKNLVGRTIKIGGKTAKIVDVETWNDYNNKRIAIYATADGDYLNKTIALVLDTLDKKETDHDDEYFGKKGQSIEVSDEEPEKMEVTKESYREFISYVLKNSKNKNTTDFLNKEHMFLTTVPRKYRSNNGNIHNAVAATIKKLGEVYNW